MKKYKVKQTGKEIKLGDIIAVVTTRRTSFGVLNMKEVVPLTKDLLNTLIKDGLVEAITPKKNEELSFYVGLLAQKLGRDYNEVASMLDDMNKVCSRAVLDLLLDTIAQVFYNEDPKGFDEAEHYYSIRLYDGKCGEVHRVHSRIPLFKSKEDVEAAREILKEQLVYMYGES